MKYTKVYAVMNRNTGYVSHKSVGNPIYVRQSDATKKLKKIRKYASDGKDFDVVEAELNWKIIPDL
jgi:hypothetical protein